MLGNTDKGIFYVLIGKNVDHSTIGLFYLVNLKWLNGVAYKRLGEFSEYVLYRSSLTNPSCQLF